VRGDPRAQAGNASKETTKCVGDCSELAAQGGTRFTWDTNSTLSATDSFNPVACPAATTTYYVEVENDFGCRSRDSITINVVPGPTVSVAMTDVSVCGARDGTLTITAQGGPATAEYSIDGGLTYQATNTFNNLPASAYLVVVRSGTCEVPYPNNPVVIGGASAPTITAVPVTNPSCEADDGTITVEANGALGIQYSINGGVSWVTTNEFTNLAGGIYYVAVASSDLSCVTYYPPVTLVQPVAPVFTDVSSINPSDCNSNDGSITVIAAGD